MSFPSLKYGTCDVTNFVWFWDFILEHKYPPDMITINKKIDWNQMSSTCLKNKNKEGLDMIINMCQSTQKIHIFLWAPKSTSSMPSADEINDYGTPTILENVNWIKSLIFNTYGMMHASHTNL